MQGWLLPVALLPGCVLEISYTLILPERSPHFVCSDDVLVVEVRFSVEESHNGNVETVEIVSDAQFCALLLTG